jgi:hypothetical protein
MLAIVAGGENRNPIFGLAWNRRLLVCLSAPARHFHGAAEKQNSAHAVERTMAPRQLFSQPMEDDNNPEPGSKRVRPSSADESSTQVRLRARASACGTPWPGPAHWLALLALAWANGHSSPLLARETCAAKTLMSAAAPPFYYHSFGYPLQSSSEAQTDLGAIRCIQMVISKNIGTPHA